MYWLPVFILIVIVAYWLKDAMKNVKVPNNIGKDKNSMLIIILILVIAYYLFFELRIAG